MKDKIIKFFENSISSEIILKRIAIYLFVICILLGLVFFKLNEINENLLTITKPISSQIKTEKNESVADIFIEDKGEIGDVLPLYDELEENTSDSTTNNSVETTSNHKENETETDTTKEVSTTEIQNTFKMDFVININSKKIHYADCTFVNRMKEENRKKVQLSENELKQYLNSGYSLCSTCGG